MNPTSLQIVRDLPQYTDAQLKQLRGLLCLDAYGVEVGAQVARFVYVECDRREALMAEVMAEAEEALTA